MKVLLVVLLMLATFVFPQGTLENREIIIYGERQLTLPEVGRNYEKINFTVPRENFPAQVYEFPKNVLPKLAEVNTKTKILPVGEPIIDKLYPYFLKCGFGNYFTPLLEVSAASKRNQKFMYVAHYNHLSSLKGPLSHSGLSNNEFEVTTKYFSKNLTINCDFDFNRRMYHFYGYDRAAEPNKKSDTIKQVYSEPTFRLGARYNSKDSLFVSKIVGNYEGLFSKKYSKENDIGYNFYSEYNLRKRNLPGKVLLTSNLAVINKIDVNKLNRYLFELAPTYVYTLKGLDIEGGFNIASENDSSKYSKGIHFYPILKISSEVYKGIGVYLNLTGNMVKNSIKSFSYQNPYLERNLEVFHTNNKLELHSGVNLGLLKNLYFNLSGKVQKVANLPFFINSKLDSSRFVTSYDSVGNTILTQFNSSISYEVSKYFGAINFEFNKYKLGDGRLPMHRPTLIVKSNHSVYVKDKVVISLNLYYLGGLSTYNNESLKNTVKLKNIFDVSIGLKYNFNSKSGLFLDVNNIFSKKYERYLYYKSQGINFVIGAFASF